MAIDPEQLQIKNNVERNRFELTMGDKTALLTYTMSGNRIIFIHTEVPPEFQGTGIGNRLAQTALEFAKAQEYFVLARCPFVAAYIRRHPEYQSLLKH